MTIVFKVYLGCQTKSIYFKAVRDKVIAKKTHLVLQCKP